MLKAKPGGALLEASHVEGVKEEEEALSSTTNTGGAKPGIEKEIEATPCKGRSNRHMNHSSLKRFFLKNNRNKQYHSLFYSHK